MIFFFFYDFGPRIIDIYIFIYEMPILPLKLYIYIYIIEVLKLQQYNYLSCKFETQNGATIMIQRISVKLTIIL